MQHISERRAHSSRRLHKDSTILLPHPGQQPPLYLARGCIRYATGHCRWQKQLLGCSQLHLCRVAGLIHLSDCREGMEEITRSSSRAAATVAIRGAASCAVALAGRFTCGTDELCGGRRPASRHGCCARFLSPSAVCTPANDDTRTRSSRCPSLASIRPCTLRAAINCMPRDISGGGSSFGAAASCTCCVVGFIICQMQGAGGGNYTIEQQEQRQPMRFIALHRAQ